MGAYEKHCLSDVHQFNLEKYISQYHVYTEKPVVLVSIFEHNANLLPWRETGANVVLIKITENGDFDYDYLQFQLNKYANHDTVKVGSFMSGSNVTGTLFDVDRIAVMCHKAGFLACFDYAATCPYIDINMNGPTRWYGYQDHFKKLSPED